jgi:glycosyltransferase involved in cell wall biosynthesis
MLDRKSFFRKKAGGKLRASLPTTDEFMTPDAATSPESKSHRTSLFRAMIMYEHCSPHQVTAVEAARQHFADSGNTLIPLECFSGSAGYGWSFADRPRPEGWLCLFPGREQVESNKIVQAVREMVRAQRIDVLAINGWYGTYAWPLIFFKRKLGCRVVMVSDSNKWDKPRSVLKEWAKRRLLRKVDAGFAAGIPQREYLTDLGLPAEQISLGNDVVDTPLYSSIPVREITQNRTIVIGTAARLIPEKNLLAALDALVIVCRRHPNISLTWRIAGKGPEEKRIRDAISEQGAPVELMGFIGYYEMPRFYAGLDLYWQPSVYEPWGLVVNEAMASALPVLVSERCGCARDLVSKENGWKHSVTNVMDMTAGLEEAIGDIGAWPKFGAKSRDIIAHWGPERFASGLFAACQLALG